MQEPQSADQIDNVRFLVQTYTDMGKTIIYKNRTAWDSMSTEKYEEYDAVIIAHTEQRCPSHDPDTYYDPFSNYENWGPAVRNGNSIILGSNNIKPYYFTDPVDKVMIHGAALFSVSNGVKTGAYISFGRIYRECTELGSTWLNFAFGIEETQEDRFEILWNLGNAKIWNRINAALPTIHPALKNITSDTFDESRFGEAQTLFANNPSEFTAYAHSWPNNYYPFILFKESWTSSPTHSPTSFPSIDKLTPYYARDAFYARDVIDFNWPTRSPTPVQDPCKNNATFFANANETKTCDWIANLGPLNQEKFCSKLNIQKQCPESCGIDCEISTPSLSPSASCQNNATFFANANETKTCDWIANLGQRNKEKFCSKWNIKKQCPESCDLAINQARPQPLLRVQPSYPLNGCRPSHPLGFPPACHRKRHLSVQPTILLRKDELSLQPSCHLMIFLKIRLIPHPQDLLKCLHKKYLSAQPTILRLGQPNLRPSCLLRVLRRNRLIPQQRDVLKCLHKSHLSARLSLLRFGRLILRPSCLLTSHRRHHLILHSQNLLKCHHKRHPSVQPSLLRFGRPILRPSCLLMDRRRHRLILHPQNLPKCHHKRHPSVRPSIHQNVQHYSQPSLQLKWLQTNLQSF